MPIPLARFLSYLFHPILAPIYTTSIILGYNRYLLFIMPAILVKALFAALILCTIILPISIILLLKNRGIVSSLQMDNQDERTFPFLFTAASFALGYYLLLKLRLPPIFSTTLIAACIGTTLAILINLKYKISIHMIGIGGMAGIIWALGQRWIIDLHLPLVFILLMAGLLGTARLSLNSHRPSQVYWGFIVGFISSSILFLI